MRATFSCMFLTLSLLASATTYYIDPAGSNTNDGSSARPWSNLSYACSKVKTSGDIIHVNQGTYIETSQSILAVGVSIEGEGITSIIYSHVTASETPTIYAYSTSIVSGNQHISNLKMDGNGNTAWSAMRFVGRSDVTVHDCTIQNFNMEGIGIIHPNTSGDIPTTWLTGCEVYNNIIINSSRHSNAGDYAHFNGCLNFTGIDGILVHDNYMTSLKRGVYGGVAELIACYRFWKNCKIYNNTLFHEPDPETWNIALEMFYSQGGNQIYNNEIKGGCIDLCWNYCVYPALYSVEINNNEIGSASLNTILDMVGVALETDSYNVIIRNNHFKHNTRPIAMTLGYPNLKMATEYMKDIDIYNNTIDSIGYTGGNWGVGIGFGKYVSGSLCYFENISICNNIINGTSTSEHVALWGIEIAAFENATFTNVSIRNNIIMGWNDSPFIVHNFESGANISNLSVENNIFFKNTLSDSPVYLGITPTNYTYANNQTNNPAFVSSSDYHLKTGSPAIDAGINVGLPYGGSAPDIGAFETNLDEIPLPIYQSSVIENITPNRLDLTYNLALSSIAPVASAFSVTVNSTSRSVSSVAISGTKVLLTLASPITYGDIVTLAYTKPATNPIQAASGGQAASFTAQPVINNCTAPVNQPPIVNISSPNKSTAFIAPAMITIDAVASDPDGAISKVEFYNGTTKLGERTAVPYSYIWKDVTDGAYSVTAVAIDNQNAKAVSAAVSIVVEKAAAAVNQLPVVSVTSTNQGKRIKKNNKITIQVTASDPDGTISNVELKSGGITLAEMRTAPYTYTWTASDTGTYIITATATDNLGAKATSSDLEFFVEDFYDPNSELIKLFPNPNNGHFAIDLIASFPYPEKKITIISLDGKTVYSDILTDEENSREFDLSESAPGTYVMMITSSNLILTTKKFIKN